MLPRPGWVKLAGRMCAAYGQSFATFPPVPGHRNPPPGVRRGPLGVEAPTRVLGLWDGAETAADHLGKPAGALRLPDPERVFAPAWALGHKPPASSRRRTRR